MGKTNPLNDDDLLDFIAAAEEFCGFGAELVGRRGGHRPRRAIDLSVKNPKGGDEVALRSPRDILDEIAALDAESAEVLATIRELVA